jgi:hypothetical protein
MGLVFIRFFSLTQPQIMSSWKAQCADDSFQSEVGQRAISKEKMLGLLNNAYEQWRLHNDVNGSLHPENALNVIYFRTDMLEN